MENLIQSNIKNNKDKSYRYDYNNKASIIIENRILSKLEEITPNILDNYIENIYNEINNKIKKEKKKKKINYFLRCSHKSFPPFIPLTLIAISLPFFSIVS